MSATAATLTKLLAWRPGGYLRASGVLFGWLVLIDWTPARWAWGYLAAPCALTAHDQC